jgi:sec-independent protein translocase protein TatB
MFDMGFLELLVIGIIALIVLGPERLPKAARTVGLWVGKAKQSFESIKTEIDRELKVKELQEQIAQQKAELEQSAGLDTLKSDFEQAKNTIHSEAEALQNEFDQEIAQHNQSILQAEKENQQPQSKLPHQDT